MASTQFASARWCWRVYPRLFTPVVAREYMLMPTRLCSVITWLDEMIEPGWLREVGRLS